MYCQVCGGWYPALCDHSPSEREPTNNLVDLEGVFGDKPVSPWESYDWYYVLLHRTIWAGEKVDDVESFYDELYESGRDRIRIPLGNVRPRVFHAENAYEEVTARLDLYLHRR